MPPLNHFLSYGVRQGLSLNLKLADGLAWLFSVDKIPRRSRTQLVKQHQQAEVSLVLMGATTLFLRLVSLVLRRCLPLVSVFPSTRSPSSEVTPIFLICVNQLASKCLIIVLICIPLIANEDEQLLKFGGRYL